MTTPIVLASSKPCRVAASFIATLEETRRPVGVVERNSLPPAKVAASGLWREWFVKPWTILLPASEGSFGANRWLLAVSVLFLIILVGVSTWVMRRRNPLLLSEPKQKQLTSNSVTPMCDGLLPSLDSTAPPGAMPSTSAPSVWSSATALKEVSHDRKNPIAMSFEIPKFSLSSCPFLCGQISRLSTYRHMVSGAIALPSVSS
jgi:hypothetical protein